MLTKSLKNLFSLQGLSLVIGIVGGLSAIFNVLISEWGLQISLKWLIFFIYFSFTILLLLLKVIFDLNQALTERQGYTTSVIRFVPNSQIFLVHKSDFLGHSAMVSFFYLDDSFEVELGKGYVKNIQDNFIQIKLLSLSDDFVNNHKKVLFDIDSNNVVALQRIVVKSYVTYDGN